MFYPFKYLRAEYRAMWRQGNVPWLQFVITPFAMLRCWWDGDTQWVGARGGLTWDKTRGWE